MLSLKAEVNNFLKARLTRIKNWSKEKATAGVNAYEQFLKLKAVMKDYKATKLSPTPLIDEVWHLHVLDTLRYANDCFDFCGEVIHHDVDGDIDVVKREIRRNATKVAYEMQNGTEPEGEMWSFDSATSNKQSLQSRYMIGSKRPASDSQLMIASQESLPEAMNKKIIMKLDAVNSPEFHHVTINVSNGKNFKIQVIDDTKLNEVFESIANHEGVTDYKQWQVSVEGDIVRPSSAYERYRAFGYRRNWKIILPGSTKKRIAKERTNVEINLIPARYLLPTYFVDVKVTSNEYYRVKINKKTELQDIVAVLPKDVGRWKQSDEGCSLQANNLQEDSTVNLEFKPWSDEQFQIRVIGLEHDFPFVVKRRTNICRVLSSISDRTGYPSSSLRFMFGGGRLPDYGLLESLNIDHGSIINMLPGQSGC